MAILIFRLICSGIINDNRCDGEIRTFNKGIFLCELHGGIIRCNPRHTFLHNLKDDAVYKLRCNEYFSGYDFCHKKYKKVIYNMLLNNSFLNTDVISYIVKFI